MGAESYTLCCPIYTRHNVTKFHFLKRNIRSLFAVISLIIFLSGCATTKDFSSVETLKPSSSGLKVVLMPLDVELSVLTAGGMLEPRADWTEDAKHFMIDALKEEETTRHIRIVLSESSAKAEPIDKKITEIERLHRAVGQAIQVHQYLIKLPTKKDKFSWTLGPEASVIKEKYDADYALFIYVRDSYASAGRVLAQLAAAALGVGISGGQQIGFTSLVDLHTGNIVWFNYLQSEVGDLRKPESASKTVALLLKGFPE